MVLTKNKKGVFFLMLALIIISLFILSISFLSTLAIRESVQKRVETLSEFVRGVEDDLPRQLFIFGYNSIAVIQLSVIPEGYLGEGNLQVMTEEAFFSGTVQGQSHALLDGARYDTLESLLKERASKIGATIDIYNPSINVTQEDPWNLKYTFKADIEVKDTNNLANWNKTLETTTLILISNFTDPIYDQGSRALGLGPLDKDIMINPEESFGTLASLQTQLEQGLYRNYSSGNAPSFIDRLEGNIGGTRPSPRYPQYGIESFVHLENDLGGGPLPERSVVDYIYFNGQSHTRCQVGSGTLPSWFRLDNPEHTNLYDVTCD